ncbi:MAG: hypothetical protein ACRCUE_17220 [Bosea sp. (in: a-proteobacteria)]
MAPYTPNMLPAQSPPSDDDTHSWPSYEQRPRPVGVGVVYRLEDSVLEMDSTRHVVRVQLGEVEQVRFTFKPGNIASTGYVTQLRLKNGKTITIGDTSWRSMVEVERGGKRYVDFITALSQAIAAANPTARFLAGKPPAVWVAFSVVAVIAVATMAVFSWRAYTEGVMGAVWIGLVIGGVAMWQMVPLIRLNRPISLKTGEVPAHLMPDVPGNAT